MRNTILHATILCAATSLAVGCIDEIETTDEVETIDEDEAARIADDSFDPEAQPDDVAASPEVAALPPGCSMYATTPTLEGTTIEGGGNWFGCPSTSRFTIKLKRHRTWWPDSTLATGTGTGAEGWVRLLKGNCWRGNSVTVYSEIKHENSGTTRQARVTLPCAF